MLVDNSLSNLRNVSNVAKNDTDTYVDAYFISPTNYSTFGLPYRGEYQIISLSCSGRRVKRFYRSLPAAVIAFCKFAYSLMDNPCSTSYVQLYDYSTHTLIWDYNGLPF